MNTFGPHTEFAPNERFRALIQRAALQCALAHVAYLSLFAFLGVPALALANVLSVAMHLLAWRLAHRERGATTAALVMGTEIIGHGILATLYLGTGSAFHTLMLPLIILAMLFRGLRPRTRWLAVGLVTVSFLGVDALLDSATPWHALDPQLLHRLRLLNQLTLVAMVAILAHHNAGMLAEAMAHMRELAGTDPLTGALNRRAMMHRVAQELARQQRGALPTSVLMCDVDHFKLLNDRRGHQVGDEVLRHLVWVIEDTVRDIDVLCRWGGEEFLIMLPQTDHASAMAVAERIRGAAESRPALVQGQPTKATLTVGVATLQPKEGFEEALQRADAALYTGKADGRNCCRGR